MGFTENAAKRALKNITQTNNPDAAIDWILTHMNDEDLNDPLPNESEQCLLDNGKIFFQFFIFLIRYRVN